jgi:pimeloyl-ACP methyl ester carboxylesterase
MSQDIIHVYFMPGMAASPKIFEYIKLPENQFSIHYLEWMLPIDNESIEAYALRLTSTIEHDNIVLIGVSFGGVLVQEMAKHINARKLIIVSSIKSKHELPRKLGILRAIRFYNLVPLRWVNKIEIIKKYTFSSRVYKKLEQYDRYLSVKNSKYLRWAFKEMLLWNQEVCLPDIVHIHGDSDTIFPLKNIKNCMIVENGSHAMILTKYQWFNENLPAIILED